MPIQMPPVQAQAYDGVIRHAMIARGSGRRGYMLEILQRLRGVSLHPHSPDLAGGDVGYFNDSARLQALFALVDQIEAKREKVLIFCESLAIQGLLAVEIRWRYKLPHASDQRCYRLTTPSSAS